MIWLLGLGYIIGWQVTSPMIAAKLVMQQVKREHRDYYHYRGHNIDRIDYNCSIVGGYALGLVWPILPLLLLPRAAWRLTGNKTAAATDYFIKRFETKQSILPKPRLGRLSDRRAA